MAHKEQVEYCKRIKSENPEYFKHQTVIDCGSLDINGNNKYLFEDSNYIGVDLGNGKNVDVISPIHKLDFEDNSYSFVISTEMLEHDQHYADSLLNMIRMLKPNCMMMITCATTGRPEHGTRRTTKSDAPLLDGDWADYYKNLDETDIRNIPGFIDYFKEITFEVNHSHKDLQFFGIKK